MHRVLAIPATVLFAWMAAIQLNDPDPLYWFPVYGGVAMTTLAAVFGRRLPRFTLVMLGAVVAGLLIAAPGFADYLRSADWAALFGRMSPDRPYVESAREFLGLAIAGCALLPLLRGRNA